MRSLASALQPQPAELRTSTSSPLESMAPKLQLMISKLARALPTDFAGCAPDLLVAYYVAKRWYYKCPTCLTWTALRHIKESGSGTRVQSGRKRDW